MMRKEDLKPPEVDPSKLDKSYDEWFTEWKQSMDSMLYNMADVYAVKIPFSDERIEEIKEQYKLYDLDIHRELKICLYSHPNYTEKDVIDYLSYRQMMVEESFPKLFWLEYVYMLSRYKETYEEYTQFIDEMREIEDWLDMHPEVHGLTLNDVKHDYSFAEKFTSRSWGSIMSAYMNTKLKTRTYNYMSFYS